MSKRTTRRASWGAVTYDPKRKVGRIRYWAETADGYRRCSRTVRGTRKQVEEERARLMLEHGHDAPCPTVSQVWERWVLPTYERRLADGDLSANSIKAYRSTWKRHVEPRWGKVPCDEVRALAVQQWISDGRTREVARVGCLLMSAVMDVAMRYEYVQSNVMQAKYLMPSVSKTRTKDKEIWSLAQLGELWNYVRGYRMESAFLLSAFGSCRVGESLAVSVDDVERRVVDGITLAVVRIDKQVANRGHDVLKNTKTSAGTRSVVLVGRAAERLLEIASERDEWLTDDGVGHPMSQHVLNYQWAQAIPDELRHPFRNLRNSWQTYMRWELGVAPWLIEPMMGHAGKDVTGMYYDRPQVDVYCQTMANAYAEHPYDAAWTIS